MIKSLYDFEKLIEVNGPLYRGAKMPPVKKLAINESKMPDNMRAKYYQVDILDENSIQLYWMTQEPFTTDNAEEALKEVKRAINAIVKANKYTEHLNVHVTFEARDGADRGYEDFTFTVNDEAKKENINIRESLNRLDAATCNDYDLLNTYNSVVLNEERKATLAKMLKEHTDAKKIARFLINESQSKDLKESLNESDDFDWSIYDDYGYDDYEDDWDHANTYGGDLTDCPICGSRLSYDEDGDSYCNNCGEDAYWLAQERRERAKNKNESKVINEAISKAALGGMLGSLKNLYGKLMLTSDQADNILKACGKEPQGKDATFDEILSVAQDVVATAPLGAAALTGICETIFDAFMTLVTAGLIVIPFDAGPTGEIITGFITALPLTAIVGALTALPAALLNRIILLIRKNLRKEKATEIETALEKTGVDVKSLDDKQLKEASEDPDNDIIPQDKIETVTKTLVANIDDKDLNDEDKENLKRTTNVDSKIIDKSNSVLDLITNILKVVEIGLPVLKSILDIVGTISSVAGKSKSSTIGEAFSYEDSEFFTREEVDDFAEKVCEHVNETFYERFEVQESYITNNEIEVVVYNDELGEFTGKKKVDMRRIRKPSDLDKYVLDIAADIIEEIKEVLIDSDYHDADEDELRKMGVFDDDLDLTEDVSGADVKNIAKTVSDGINELGSDKEKAAAIGQLVDSVSEDDCQTILDMFKDLAGELKLNAEARKYAKEQGIKADNLETIGDLIDFGLKVFENKSVGNAVKAMIKIVAGALFIFGIVNGPTDLFITEIVTGIILLIPSDILLKVLYTLPWLALKGGKKLIRGAQAKKKAKAAENNLKEAKSGRSIEIEQDGDEPPYLIGSSSESIDVGDRFDLTSDELWSTGWVGSVQNIEDGPFTSFDEIDIYCYDEEKGNEYDLPKIPKNIQTKFLAVVNEYINSHEQEEPKQTSNSSPAIKYSEDGKTLIKYKANNQATTFKIPDGVTSIGEEAFAWCENLTSIVIPDSVTEIGEYAFNGCTSLTRVAIGSNVTSIGKYAFSSCTSLTNITIPDSVTDIGRDAFRGCKNLTSINIPDSVTSISAFAFAYCESLTSIEIPDSITSIGNGAFASCKSLTSIEIPNSVTSIGDWVFEHCTSLTSLTIPDSVISIGTCIFDGCWSLKTVYCGAESKPDGWHSYWNRFIPVVWGYKKSNLTEDSQIITVDPFNPDLKDNTNIIFAEDFTHMDIDLLDEILASDFGIEDFKNHVDDYGLVIEDNKLVIPEGAKATFITSDDYGSYITFSSDTDKFLLEFDEPFKVTLAAKNTLHESEDDEVRDDACDFALEYIINNNNFIDYSVESDGDQLSVTLWKEDEYGDEEEVTFTMSISKLIELVDDEDAFADYIESAEDCINYGAQSEEFYRRAEQELEKHFNCTGAFLEPSTQNGQGGTFLFSDDVAFEGSFDFQTGEEYIRNDDFEGFLDLCKDSFTPVDTDDLDESLTEDSDDDSDNSDVYTYTGGKLPKDINPTKVIVADGVKAIDERAFAECTSLQSIIIPESVKRIQSHAFRNCINLTNVQIPNSVLYIREKAFYKCQSLTSITIPDSVKSIGDSAFFDCEKLTSVTIGNGVTEIGDSAFRHCISLTNLVIPNSVTMIWHCAFAGCRNLTDVTISDNASVGIHVFRYCDKLTNVKLGDNMESIGSNMFEHCISLKHITIPNSVTSIQSQAFSNCTSLESITIGNNVTLIRNRAFEGCTSLTSIEIPNSVTEINSEAFQRCTSLKSIIIPANMTSMGRWVFEDCDSLTIYCEVESQPDNWPHNWNSSNCPVVWGYKKSNLKEDLDDDLFGVFSTGGSIGSNDNDNLRAWNGDKSGQLVKVFNSRAEAQDYAKSLRKSLSKGERSYYGMTYFTKKLSKKEKEHPQVIRLMNKSVIKESSDDNGPYSYKETEAELQSLTQNWTVEKDQLKCGYDEEKNYGMEILSKHGYECKADRQGGWWIVDYWKESLKENKSDIIDSQNEEITFDVLDENEEVIKTFNGRDYDKLIEFVNTNPDAYFVEKHEPVEVDGFGYEEPEMQVSSYYVFDRSEDDSLTYEMLRECLKEAWNWEPEFKTEDGWTEEDIAKWKEIDWAPLLKQHIGEVAVPEDNFMGKAVLYGDGYRPQYKEVKFVKKLHSNPIYPPNYEPEENPFPEHCGPMYDGTKHNGLMVHDRYETWANYDMLSRYFYLKIRIN